MMMNDRITSNFARVSWPLFLLPLVLLLGIFLFFYSNNALTSNSYISIQKDLFFALNAELSKYSSLEYNLTQLGDALIILSFLSIFFVSAPKLWEALISASLVSLVLTNPLKKMFSVPRPAAVLDHEHFEIIGRQLSGSTSLPSGHAVTVFTILTVLMFAWMPGKIFQKIGWCLLVVAIGLFLIFTRVGVGAHYPADVVIGGIVGYICGFLGILISTRTKIWKWLGDKKFYPIFILLFLACIVAVVNKILGENLIIFYLVLAALAVSLYKIFVAYVRK